MNEELYFKDCFTEVEKGKINAEFNKVTMKCFDSDNQAFSMDCEGNLVVNSIITKENNNLTTDFNAIYPIGSIYMSISDVNPSTLFGGTWEAWGNGRVPVGVDQTQTEFNEPEKIGGSKYLQKHNHTGRTGTGFVDFMRIVLGTMVNRNTANHQGSSGDSSYYDLHNTNEYPGGNHYHEFTTNDTGEGDSGNLQPYITCYMWKRIA